MIEFNSKIQGFDRIFRFQIAMNSTIGDACDLIQESFSAQAKYSAKIYNNVLSQNLKITDCIPKESIITFVPFSDDVRYSYQHIFYPEDTPSHFKLFSTVNLESMKNGDDIIINENDPYEKVYQDIQNFLISKFKINADDQLHLFLAGGCPYLKGTIQEYEKVCQKSRKRIYVIITNRINENLLNNEVFNVCSIKDDMKKLISPSCESSIPGLCTMASLLGYIHRNGEDVEYLTYAMCRFIPFAPLICALFQFQNRCTVNGRNIIQITAPLFTLLRDIAVEPVADENILENALKYLTYFINMRLKGEVPCSEFVKVYYNIGYELYLKENIDQDVTVLFDPDFRNVDWIFFKFDNPTKELIEFSCDAVHSLDVLAPMDLRAVHRAAFFTGSNGPWLFVSSNFGKKRDVKNQLNIINPEEGKLESVDPEHFAKQIAITVRSATPLEYVDPKKVAQIVYILLDTSNSMKDQMKQSIEESPNQYPEDNFKPTRYNIAKECFTTFMNCAYASLTFSLYGLIQFDNNVKKLCDPTIISPDFEKNVQNLELGQRTAIFKAIDFAIDELKPYQEKYTNAVPRIIVLTDGKDVLAEKRDYTGVINNVVQYKVTGINTDIGNVANKLVRNHIRLDSVYFIKDDDDIDQRLYHLTKITGGCAFNTKSLDEGLSFFEQEPFYNIHIRKFDPFKNENYTHSQINNMPEVPPNQWEKFVPMVQSDIVEKKSKLVSPLYVAAKYQGKDDPPGNKKRILRELRKIAANPAQSQNIRVFPFEDSIDMWRVLIKGPEQSLYENRWFYLTIKFPSQYPNVPPDIRFVQPPFHYNIGDNGRICLNVLDSDYRSNDSVMYLLTSITELLLLPNTQEAIDMKRIDLLDPKKRDIYENLVQDYNKKNSYDTPDHWLKDWTFEADPIDVDVDLNQYVEAEQIFRCSLTGKIMKEPVKASSNVFFEKKVLEQFVQNGDAYCPVTGEILKKEDNMNLPVDNDLKHRIAQWENSRKI
ncbi:hypothetical protein TRFO_01793 [Tritrichomonas foetus]|uniref:Ubiquitin-conjugating enzyme family protein n=1 Tax=Tritrichomonas foetus TaxID=1144522 RepID=A0A1J4JUG8_9EUKA|nr:hypothetical protein TRFO_01793 [Tritrichomonas foetus]|eukprot:OHT01164.1 hypothetical protein TRFO_01793 [Tritrichomonas foetus]